MKKEKVTKVHVVVCDQGMYGADYCGNCGCRLDTKVSYEHCPDCKYKFEGTVLAEDFGGSDFY